MFLTFLVQIFLKRKLLTFEACSMEHMILCWAFLAVPVTVNENRLSQRGTDALRMLGLPAPCCMLFLSLCCIAVSCQGI